MSVLYCKTSIPPVCSITTAFMVLGREDIVLMLISVLPRCELTAASRVDAIDDLVNSCEVLKACAASVMDVIYFSCEIGLNWCSLYVVLLMINTLPLISERAASGTAPQRTGSPRARHIATYSSGWRRTLCRSVQGKSGSCLRIRFRTCISGWTVRPRHCFIIP